MYLVWKHIAINMANIGCIILYQKVGIYENDEYGRCMIDILNKKAARTSLKISLEDRAAFFPFFVIFFKRN